MKLCRYSLSKLDLQSTSELVSSAFKARCFESLGLWRVGSLKGTCNDQVRFEMHQVSMFTVLTCSRSTCTGLNVHHWCEYRMISDMCMKHVYIWLYIYIYITVHIACTFDIHILTICVPVQPKMRLFTILHAPLMPHKVRIGRPKAFRCIQDECQWQGHCLVCSNRFIAILRRFLSSTKPALIGECSCMYYLAWAWDLL